MTDGGGMQGQLPDLLRLKNFQRVLELQTIPEHSTEKIFTGPMSVQVLDDLKYKHNTKVLLSMFG